MEIKVGDKIDTSSGTVEIKEVFANEAEMVNAGYKFLVKTICNEWEIFSKSCFTLGNEYAAAKIRMEIPPIEKEMKTVPVGEFIHRWNKMEKYWFEEEGDCGEDSFYEKIISQDINIELPLLGIKTELYWCPEVVEALDNIFKEFINQGCIEMLVESESCYYTGSGIWIAEVPFHMNKTEFVMMVNTDNLNDWTVYRNIPKENGQFEEIEHDELVYKFGNTDYIPEEFSKYYTKALQLLASKLM